MRIILAIFDNERYEAFTSLKPLYEKYPGFKKEKHNIEYYLSRKNKPYKTEKVELYRLEVEKSSNGI